MIIGVFIKRSFILLVYVLLQAQTSRYITMFFSSFSVSCLYCLFEVFILFENYSISLDCSVGLYCQHTVVNLLCKRNRFRYTVHFRNNNCLNQVFSLAELTIF